MLKNYATTIDNLYQAVKAAKSWLKTKSTILRGNRNVLRRPIIAHEAGRKVDLHSVLNYELMLVPVALAEMNGSLRTGSPWAKNLKIGFLYQLEGPALSWSFLIYNY